MTIKEKIRNHLERGKDCSWDKNKHSQRKTPSKCSLYIRKWWKFWRPK